MISVLTSASERLWVLRLISFPGAAEAVEPRVSRCLGCSEKACIPPGTDWFAQARMLWPVCLIDRGKERGSAEKFGMMKRDSSRGIGCRGRKKFHWKSLALLFFPSRALIISLSSTCSYLTSAKCSPSLICWSLMSDDYRPSMQRLCEVVRGTFHEVCVSCWLMILIWIHCSYCFSLYVLSFII